MTPWQRRVDEWISVIARACGLIGLIAFSVVWIVTQRYEPILIAAAGTMYGIGKGQQARATLRQEPPIAPPVPDSSTHPKAQQEES